VPIRVFGHHVELTPELRGRVTEKAEHLRRIFDGIVTVHVTLDAEKERRMVEIVANVSHGAPVVTRVTTQDFHEAIDLAFTKIEAQLRKHKDKLRDRRVRHPEAAEASPAASEEPEETPDATGAGSGAP